MERLSLVAMWLSMNAPHQDLQAAVDLRHVLALLSARDARIMELEAALEPFAMAATRQPIMAGRGSNTNYRTPADTDPFVRLMSWGDFRRASRALAASKGVE